LNQFQQESNNTKTIKIEKIEKTVVDLYENSPTMEVEEYDLRQTKLK
jgi:hypothetical protein